MSNLQQQIYFLQNSLHMAGQTRTLLAQQHQSLLMESQLQFQTFESKLNSEREKNRELLARVTELTAKNRQLEARLDERTSLKREEEKHEEVQARQEEGEEASSVENTIGSTLDKSPAVTSLATDAAATSTVEQQALGREAQEKAIACSSSPRPVSTPPATDIKDELLPDIKDELLPDTGGNEFRGSSPLQGSQTQQQPSCCSLSSNDNDDTSLPESGGEKSANEDGEEKEKFTARNDSSRSSEPKTPDIATEEQIPTTLEEPTEVNLVVTQRSKEELQHADHGDGCGPANKNESGDDADDLPMVFPPEVEAELDERLGLRPVYPSAKAMHRKKPTMPELKREYRKLSREFEEVGRERDSLRAQLVEQKPKDCSNCSKRLKVAAKLHAMILLEQKQKEEELLRRATTFRTWYFRSEEALRRRTNHLNKTICANEVLQARVKNLRLQLLSVTNLAAAAKSPPVPSSENAAESYAGRATSISTSPSVIACPLTSSSLRDECPPIVQEEEEEVISRCEIKEEIEEEEEEEEDTATAVSNSSSDGEDYTRSSRLRQQGETAPKKATTNFPVRIATRKPKQEVKRMCDDQNISGGPSHHEIPPSTTTATKPHEPYRLDRKVRKCVDCGNEEGAARLSVPGSTVMDWLHDASEGLDVSEEYSPLAWCTCNLCCCEGTTMTTTTTTKKEEKKAISPRSPRSTAADDEETTTSKTGSLADENEPRRGKEDEEETTSEAQKDQSLDITNNEAKNSGRKLLCWSCHLKHLDLHGLSEIVPPSPSSSSRSFSNDSSSMEPCDNDGRLQPTITSGSAKPLKKRNHSKKSISSQKDDGDESWFLPLPSKPCSLAKNETLCEPRTGRSASSIDHFFLNLVSRYPERVVLVLKHRTAVDDDWKKTRRRRIKVTARRNEELSREEVRRLVKWRNTLEFVRAPKELRQSISRANKISPWESASSLTDFSGKGSKEGEDDPTPPNESGPTDDQPLRRQLNSTEVAVTPVDLIIRRFMARLSSL